MLYQKISPEVYDIYVKDFFGRTYGWSPKDVDELDYQTVEDLLLLQEARKECEG